ncbi:antitoxin TumA [Geminocystis sp. CENA526]|uniref:antitoxin TumA n=1 Tax=Geminocystis sp. CENA526 TaxID=1355871 RepID=UPI003D6F0501
MQKQTILYTSKLDALIAVAKRLSMYETEQNMDSEEFFHRYNQGLLSDDVLFVEWANDYQHYLALHKELSQKLNYVAA